MVEIWRVVDPRPYSPHYEGPQKVNNSIQLSAFNLQLYNMEAKISRHVLII